MSEPQKKFYLTTPIYYVNARPHIGHAYTTIAADVIARRHRLLGDDTFLLTGTDEHGQKIERSAAAAGIPPQQFADEVSASFENLWKRMGITNDAYIRTTDPRHKRGVQKLWKTLADRGAIYLSSYTGQYSIGEEMFVEGPPGTIGPDGKPTETVTEENYFFKLSDYQLRIIDLIESNELLIQPEVRRNEVLSFLRGNITATQTSTQSTGAPSMAQSHRDMGGNVFPSPASDNPVTKLSAAGTPYIPGTLKDLSISRSSFKWGIPVPGDEKHVVYVWLDALANYMTAIGYGSDDPKDQATFEKYWPADLHLVGKEIIRFHCVYWPAFLMAANLPLPKAITAHGWLLFEDSKMSKSRGNIVRTETILDAFGTLCPLQPQPQTLSSFAEGGGSAVALDQPQPPTKAEQDLFASDVLRYFLLREIPFGQDGSFSFDALVQRYNSDLANGYGNLVSRTLNMLQKYFDAEVPPYPSFPPESVDSEIRFTAGACDKLKSYLIDSPFDFAYRFDKFSFNGTLEGLLQLIGSLDLFLTEQAPWRSPAGLSDNLQKIRRAQILYTASESIRIITSLLYPFMPYATSKVWSQLGLGDIELAAKNGELKNLQWGSLKPGTKLGPLSPIFPRAPKELIQLMTDMETNNTQVPTPKADEPESLKSVESVPSAVASVPAPSPTAVESSPTIAIDDFIKIDLRVAKILVAERIPKADKLLRLEVDLGYETRQILSGIAEWYTPEELIGRKIVIIANLAPRKMRGLESHGMLLAASHGENGKPILATFTEDIAPGSRLK